MSSARSRSGGTSTRIAASRRYRSGRNRRVRTSSSMVSGALATRRNAARSHRLSLRNWPSRRTRASRPCATAGSSVISCRNSVPPHAHAMALSGEAHSSSLAASVRAAPNSDASMPPASPDAQSTATSGRFGSPLRRTIRAGGERCSACGGIASAPVEKWRVPSLHAMRCGKTNRIGGNPDHPAPSRPANAVAPNHGPGTSGNPPSARSPSRARSDPPSSQK